ncbi:MAG: hypothetical protein FJ213_10750 [Ignavibacteria bacterium]|nr:hypothetical protein [Ignavibacteria bacterium]
MGNFFHLTISFIIGTLVILMLVRLTMNVGDESNETNIEQMVQSNLLNLTSTIENDFRRIGYNSPVDPILIADSTIISFTADTKLSGKADTVKYVLADISSALHTQNPNDRSLYRIIGCDTTKIVSSGLTKFKLKYFDINDIETLTPVFVKSVSVELRYESEMQVKDHYPFFEKSFLIKPRNLN